MILYTQTALASPKPTQFQVPTNAKAWLIDNFSPRSFTVSNAAGGSYQVLPFQSRGVPAASNGTWFVTPVGSVTSLELGDVQYNVTVNFNTQPVESASQLAGLPVFEGKVDATITNATVNVAGTIDANITNANIPVSGSVDATIQNASLAVTNASNTTLTVGGSVNANITNARIDVGTIAGTVDISGDVGIKAGQLVQVTNASGGSLTVAGTVDANIQNATIDTKSTVINEQLQQSMNYANYVSMSLPSAGGNITSAAVQLVPDGQSISTLAIDVIASGFPYYQGITGNIALKMSFQDSMSFTLSNVGFVLNTMSPITVSVFPDFAGSPVAFNQIAFELENTPSISATSSAKIYFIVHGQAQPPNTSTEYPDASTIAFGMPSTVQPTSMMNGVPLPLQSFQWSPSGDGYVNVASAYPLVAGTVGTSSVNTQTKMPGNILAIFGHVTNLSGSETYLNITFTDNASGNTFLYQFGVDANQTMPVNVNFTLPWQPVAGALNYTVSVVAGAGTAINAHLYAQAI